MRRSLCSWQTKRWLALGRWSTIRSVRLFLSASVRGREGLTRDFAAGTGSMLITSSAFGALTFGSDIDGRQLRGRGEGGVQIRISLRAGFLTSLCSAVHRLQRRAVRPPESDSRHGRLRRDSTFRPPSTCLRPHPAHSNIPSAPANSSTPSSPTVRPFACPPSLANRTTAPYGVRAGAKKLGRKPTARPFIPRLMPGRIDPGGYAHLSVLPLPLSPR